MVEFSPLPVLFVASVVSEVLVALCVAAHNPVADPGLCVCV